MSFTTDNVFELLPVVYRIKDAEQGGGLKALIGIIAEQAGIAEKDIGQLYKNWFIETCEEWVVPYIGDLLGVRNFHSIDDDSVISQRAYVANTLSYRRRKGIAPVLEQLSLDVTAWRAHVVEFFQLLATTQYMNHIRLSRTVAPDLRKMNELDLLDTAFDTIAHSADMRHIASGRGKYNIPNIGLFIWRLQSYPVTRSDARMYDCLMSPPSSPVSGVNYFTFDPVGLETHLFNKLQTETAITHISEEVNVPGLLRRRALFDELEARRAAIVNGEDFPYVFFDDRFEVENDPSTKKHPVFEIYPDDGSDPVPPAEILICNLDNCCLPPLTKSYKKLMADGSYIDVDMAITVAVDPVAGKFLFTDPNILKARVSYSYGFSGDLGAGTYNRQYSLRDFLNQGGCWQVGVSQELTSISGETIHTSLTAAINEWNALPAGSNGIITLMDSCSYMESCNIEIPEESRLLIVAASWPERDDPDPTVTQKWRRNGDFVASGLRPHICGDITLTGTLSDPDKKTGGDLVIDGLLIEGKLTVGKGNLGECTLAHSTLVPSFGGLEVEAGAGDVTSNQWMVLNITKCICGPVNLNQTNAVSLLVEDCIIDDGLSVDAINTPVQLTRSTFFGTVHAKIINAENCIFMDTVKAERRQTGCIRYSYIPGEIPEAPRRFRCQPELEITSQIAAIEKKSGPLSLAKKTALANTIRAWLVPGFTAVDFGHHAYGQLNFNCPVQVTTGADNGSEMGAFCFLQQPQRQANLRLALNEYMPLGLEAGILYVT